jgi:hypothetical protein
MLYAMTVETIEERVCACLLLGDCADDGYWLSSCYFKNALKDHK